MQPLPVWDAPLCVFRPHSARSAPNVSSITGVSRGSPSGPDPPSGASRLGGVEYIASGAGVTRRDVSAIENRHASRGWWDLDADDYQAEHGAFLGDVDLVW